MLAVQFAAVRRFLPLLAVLACLAACGGDDSGSGGDTRRGTLALDFQPNAVHAGIYAAGDLEVRVPAASTDSLKLLAAGRADMSVVDIHDLGLAREQGADVVGVGALVQRPLAAVIAREGGVRRPRDLEGRRVGVTGLPSDEAVLRAVVEDDGGSVERVERVTIGFSAVPSLISGRVDAVVSFWNAEGVALRERGVQTREFRVDEFGAPRYPELVLVVTRDTLENRGALVDAMLDEIARGTRAALRDRDAIVTELAREGGSDEEMMRAQLEAVAPALVPPVRLDRGALEAWAEFDARFGILREPPPVERRSGWAASRGPEQRVHERGGLARHAGARHHAVEGGLLGLPANVLLHVRVEGQPRYLGTLRLRDAGVDVVRQVHHQDVGGLSDGTGSCPAALSAPCSFEPNSRSGQSSATRARAVASLLRAAARELLPHRLGAAPHLDHLDAAGASLAQRELALDPLVVQEPERAAHGLGGRGVAELVRGADAPVPVVLRVRHGVDLHEQRRRFDVAVLVGDAQVELELRPVGRQRVEQALEVIGERHGR